MHTKNTNLFTYVGPIPAMDDDGLAVKSEYSISAFSFNIGRKPTYNMSHIRVKTSLLKSYLRISKEANISKVNRQY